MLHVLGSNRYLELEFDSVIRVDQVTLVQRTNHFERMVGFEVRVSNVSHVMNSNQFKILEVIKDETDIVQPIVLKNKQPLFGKFIVFYSPEKFAVYGGITVSGKIFYN